MPIAGMFAWLDIQSHIRTKENALSANKQNQGETVDTPSVIVMNCRGKRQVVKYFPGETLLDTARRGQVPMGSNCERGDCGACMVEVVRGRVKMHANNALNDDDIASGLTLACQSVPISTEVEIEIF